jgi:hypothetical protein
MFCRWTTSCLHRYIFIKFELSIILFTIVLGNWDCYICPLGFLWQFPNTDRKNVNFTKSTHLGYQPRSRNFHFNIMRMNVWLVLWINVIWIMCAYLRVRFRINLGPSFSGRISQATQPSTWVITQFLSYCMVSFSYNGEILLYLIFSSLENSETAARSTN